MNCHKLSYVASFLDPTLRHFRFVKKLNDYDGFFKQIHESRTRQTCGQKECASSSVAPGCASPGEFDPLQWWGQRAGRFPLLSCVAKRLVVIPASSAECKRQSHSMLSTSIYCSRTECSQKQYMTVSCSCSRGIQKQIVEMMFLLFIDLWLWHICCALYTCYVTLPLYYVRVINTSAWLDFIVRVLVCNNNCDGSLVMGHGSRFRWVSGSLPLTHSTNTCNVCKCNKLKKHTYVICLTSLSLTSCTLKTVSVTN